MKVEKVANRKQGKQMWPRKVGERERETDRQTDRQTDGQTEIAEKYQSKKLWTSSKQKCSIMSDISYNWLWKDGEKGTDFKKFAPAETYSKLRGMHFNRRKILIIWNACFTRTLAWAIQQVSVTSSAVSWTLQAANNKRMSGLHPHTLTSSSIRKTTINHNYFSRW